MKKRINIILSLPPIDDCQTMLNALEKLLLFYYNIQIKIFVHKVVTGGRQRLSVLHTRQFEY